MLQQPQEEVLDAPQQLQDDTNFTTDEIEIVAKSPRSISISSTLFTDERKKLVELLKEYQDIFAWSRSSDTRKIDR